MSSSLIYLSYFARFVKARLSYRGDFAASIFATSVISLSGVLFVIFLMDGSTISNLKGWSRDEVLFIYGFSQVSTALFNILGPNLYQFSDRYIIQGQFDRVLLRPLDTMCQVIFEAFELEACGNLLVGVGVLAYSSVQLELEFSPIDIVWLICGATSGAVLLLSVFVILASCSFHFEDRFGITPPFYNLITFSRYPLPIFNSVLQFILQWVVPFAFVGFYPATHFFSREGYSFFCYFTPAMALMFLLLARIAWCFGVARYSSVGS